MSRKMKDSGVEWIGEIPNEWNISPLGNYLKERTEKVSDTEFEPLSVTKQGIMRQLENVAKTDNGDNRKKVCKGDFVINSRSDRKQSCGLSEFEGSVSLINIVLINIGIEESYLRYVLKNHGFAEEFYRWGSGIVADLWSTKYEKMKKIMIPIPNNGALIGTYLDEKVSKIDDIISKQKILIEKYKDYKQSLITETVTKGLNKNVPMKDSGMEWIGKVPHDWNLIKYKYFAISGMGETILSERLSDDGVPVYSATQSDKVLGYLKTPKLILKEGDLVIPARGNSIGCVSIVKDTVATCTQTTIYSKINGISREYLYYCCNGLKDNWFEFDNTAIPQITVNQVQNNIVPVPDEHEQVRIADFLDKKCSEIDCVIDKKEQLIEKLESYKKSLIYECVTGKREVK